MSDASLAEWNEKRKQLMVGAALFQIDCKRRDLQRQLEELDQQERRILGLKD